MAFTRLFYWIDGKVGGIIREMYNAYNQVFWYYWSKLFIEWHFRDRFRCYGTNVWDQFYCPPTRKTIIETTTLTEVIGEWVTDFEPDQQQQQQQQDSERTTRKLNIHKRRRTPTYGRSNSASNILFHKSVLIFAISLIFISIWKPFRVLLEVCKTMWNCLQLQVNKLHLNSHVESIG